MIVYEQTKLSKRLLAAIALICAAFVALSLVLGAWFLGSLYGTGLVVLGIGAFVVHRRHVVAHNLDDNLPLVRRQSGKANLWLLACAVCFMLAMAASLLSSLEARLLAGVPFAAAGLFCRAKAGSAWGQLVSFAKTER